MIKKVIRAALLSVVIGSLLTMMAVFAAPANAVSPCAGNDCGQFQNWTITSGTNGYGEIVADGVFQSGREGNGCLDVTGGIGATADGTPLQIWSCGATMQRFAKVPISGGWDFFKAENSGKCIDVRGMSKSSWADVQIWTCMHGNLNQYWHLKYVSSGVFQLVNDLSGLCLTAIGNYAPGLNPSVLYDGANVTQLPCRA